MRLTRAGEYAVRCMLYLSKKGQGNLISRQEIAENAFNIKLEDNTAYLKGVVSRKKQVIPKIDNNIK